MARKRARQGTKAPKKTYGNDSTATNPYLNATILEIVDNQLRDGTPPETRQTFERLLNEGQTPDEARRLIGYVVANEIQAVLKNNEVFNEARFVAGLERLPTLP